MSYDPSMRWYYPAGIILALLLGLGLGRGLAPRYHAPADSSEARLKTRAVELYQAGRLFDALKMRQLYTPVRQATETAQLQDDAAQQHAYWDRLSDKEKQEQIASAANVTPGCITTETYTGEGWGWAITSGTAALLVSGQEVPQNLDRVVWVLTDGDWWVFERTNAELNTYGNPPDPVLAEMQMQVQHQAISTGQTPAAPAATGVPGA